MYLTKLIIINYRSCRCVEIDLLKDEPNILIGINDCGKTSILKGLELLLNEKPQVFSVKDGAKKKDVSNSPLDIEKFVDKFQSLSVPVPPYSGYEIVVVGKFITEEGDFTSTEIELLKPQSLWALENAAENGLWYYRSFDLEGKSKNYLLVPDNQTNEGELNSFFNLTATQLNRKRTEYKLSPEHIKNSNGVGRFSILEIVRALYVKLGVNNYWVEWKWEKNLFPSFRYLDWNSSFDNILESATEALKELIEDHLAPVKMKALEGAQAAQNALNEHLRGHKNIIAAILPQVQELTANIHFEVKEKITDLLITKSGGDGPVHIDLQGDGIKRQIWFALVKAAAINNAASNYKKHIWAFDEPETHLYPTAQRQLFEIIKEISNSTIEALISTHSTIFIDKAKLSAIKIISQDDCYTSYSNCQSIDDVFHSLELRNSDFLFYDKFLIVEGDTEEYLIPAFYKIFTGKSLREDNIQLVPLKGASNWIEQKRIFESVLEGFKKPLDQVVYLFDNDQSFKIGNSAKNTNQFFVGKQDIEDSIESVIWVQIVKEYTGGKIKLNEDIIESIKTNIDDKNEIKAHDKFIPSLKKLIKATYHSLGEEIRGEVLPSKGKDLVNLIVNQIKSPFQIPEKIIECFNYINNKPIEIQVQVLNYNKEVTVQG